MEILPSSFRFQGKKTAGVLKKNENCLILWNFPEV